MKTEAEGSQGERLFGRKVIRENPEGKNEDQAGKRVQPDRKSYLLIRVLIGFEDKRQVGKDHPKGQKIEKIRQKKYSRPESAHAWSCVAAFTPQPHCGSNTEIQMPNESQNPLPQFFPIRRASSAFLRWPLLHPLPRAPGTGPSNLIRVCEMDSRAESGADRGER